MGLLPSFDVSFVFRSFDGIIRTSTHRLITFLAPQTLAFFARCIFSTVINTCSEDTHTHGAQVLVNIDHEACRETRGSQECSLYVSAASLYIRVIMTALKRFCRTVTLRTVRRNNGPRGAQVRKEKLKGEGERYRCFNVSGSLFSRRAVTENRWRQSFGTEGPVTASQLY